MGVATLTVLELLPATAARPHHSLISCQHFYLVIIKQYQHQHPYITPVSLLMLESKKFREVDITDMYSLLCSLYSDMYFKAVTKADCLN